MTQKGRKRLSWLPMTMTAAALLLTVAIFSLRVLLMPSLRDADTGRFVMNIPALAVLVGGLLLLLVAAFCLPRVRVDVGEAQALSVSTVMILTGVVLGIVNVYDAVCWVIGGELPPPAQMQESTLTMIVLVGMLVFGVVGAVSLICFGLEIAAQGGTHVGMRGFSVLTPVIWVWLRLAWYEMSYATSIGWSERVYDFLTVIFLMLFLFKLARFATGIGKADVGMLLFYALATAVLTLSGVFTRIGLYFTVDAEAYHVGVLVGVADAFFGILALLLAWALVWACRALPVPTQPQDDLTEEDALPDVSAQPLIMGAATADDIEEDLYDGDLGSLIFVLPEEEVPEDDENS